jgi:hypothetical protein
MAEGQGRASRVLNRLDGAPWIRDMLIRAGTRIGASPENWLLLESVSRPWWLYRSSSRPVLGKVERRAPTPVTEGDVVLCDRLIAAFEAARDCAEVEARGLWAWLFDLYQRPLAEALERRDTYGLAKLLASMFQEEFTRGLMVHAHVRNVRSRLGSRILSLKSLDALASLAEALGVVPIDGPEDRRAGALVGGDLGELLEMVDQVLGFKLDFPGVGAPFGLTADGRLITLETPEQIYAATRLDQGIDTHLGKGAQGATKIVEIGGGYGGMCYWYLRMRPDARYTIVDLPIMNVIQGYFLSQALGVAAVSLYGEQSKQVTICPDSALAEVETPFGVLVNKDSMPEMPYDTMLSYLEWGRSACDGFFYSYNHEAAVEYRGQRAGRVSEAVEQIGGFTRIRRDPSWLRRGYAEEIYVRAERALGSAPRVTRPEP